MKQTAAEVSVRQIEIADDRCREGLRTRLVICTTGLVSYPAKKLLKLADLQFSGLTAAAHHTQRRYGLQETGVENAVKPVSHVPMSRDNRAAPRRRNLRML